jgi:RimJ/RimL family protein N-acetyltransferase
MNQKTLKLESRLVRLEPLDETHLPALSLAAADGRLWELFFTSVPSPDRLQTWFNTAMEMQQQGRAVAFAIRHLPSGNIIGSTRFCNMDTANKRVEIGYTWYAESMQRSGVNTHCKLLLLQHAFEAWQCNAVEFRTDWLNQRSQAAIERLGAKRDGILRRHMIMPDGRVRDTVVYSILLDEWPGVKQHLHFRLHRNGDSLQC